jgi:hypothetical protein
MIPVRIRKINRAQLEGKGESSDEISAKNSKKSWQMNEVASAGGWLLLLA